MIDEMSEANSVAGHWKMKLHCSQDFPQSENTIPRSRHNPKILGVDDAEIVGDRITELRPIPRNLFTQETERRIVELGASCVALVVRDVSVHHPPQPFDRVQVRAIGWDEVQLDPSSWQS